MQVDPSVPVMSRHSSCYEVITYSGLIPYEIFRPDSPVDQMENIKYQDIILVHIRLLRQ